MKQFSINLYIKQQVKDKVAKYLHGREGKQTLKVNPHAHPALHGKVKDNHSLTARQVKEEYPLLLRAPSASHTSLLHFMSLLLVNKSYLAHQHNDSW